MLIVVGVAVFLTLLLSIERTLIGARIRATVDNVLMARTLGINTGAIYTGVFALGSGLAALGGALGAEVIPLFPGYANSHLTTFLIVVAIGARHDDRTVPGRHPDRRRRYGMQDTDA